MSEKRNEQLDPEWEVANERTVKWNREQTAYLRYKYGPLARDPNSLPNKAIDGSAGAKDAEQRATPGEPQREGK